MSSAGLLTTSGTGAAISTTDAPDWFLRAVDRVLLDDRGGEVNPIAHAIWREIDQVRVGGELRNIQEFMED
jgi:hypothetical protein